MTKNQHLADERTDCTELPIVLEDGKHKRVTIENGECGECGYDRIRVTRDVGYWCETCTLCGAQRYDGGDGWSLPKSARDRRDELEEWTDDGNVVKYGRDRTIGRRGNYVDVFGYEDSGVVKAFFKSLTSRGLEQRNFTEDELFALLRQLEDGDGFVTDFVDQELDGKTVANDSFQPNNPNAIHAGLLEHRGLPIRLWIDIAQMDGTDASPIHFDPQADGISV